MTVKDLIDTLSKYDKRLPVGFAFGERDLCVVSDYTADEEDMVWLDLVDAPTQAHADVDRLSGLVEAALNCDPTLRPAEWAEWRDRAALALDKPSS